MSDPKAVVPKANGAVRKADRFVRRAKREFLKFRSRAPEDPGRQRGLMVEALCLLLLALSIVLWRDRDFWFSGAPEAESTQPVESSPVAKVAPVQPSTAIAHRARAAKSRHRLTGHQVTEHRVTKHQVTEHQITEHQVQPKANHPASETPAAPGATITTRTVLPALEVEVVAGDTHRTIRPGSSSVRVELQPDTPPQPVTDASAAGDSQTAANIASDAAERVQISASTSDVVASPVRPNYPLLARQMKVEGSVILQALISKDGVIQNLRVVSGPHILASAAQDAVRQWHFKPHYQGNEAVETQAKITVNFTISTN